MHVFGLQDMNVVGWQFRLVQIFISTVCVAVGTLAGAILAAWISNLYAETPDALRAALAQAPRYFTWVLYTVPMFTLPLIFAAGVRMYLTDLAEFGEDTLEWEDRLAAAIITFIGAYGLSCLPLLIAEAVTAATQTGVNLEKILPWGFAPAGFAVIFMFMSARQLAGTASLKARAINALIDIAAHAVPVAGFSYAAAAYLGMPASFAMTAAFTSGFIAALLGPIQCAISRRHICRVVSQPDSLETAEPQGWAGNLLTPNWMRRLSPGAEPPMPGAKAGAD